MGEPIQLRFMDRTLCLDLYFPFASSACLHLYLKLLEATGNRIRFLHSPGGAFGLFLFFLHSEEEKHGQKILLSSARRTTGYFVRHSKI